MLILDLWKLTVSNAIYSPFTYVFLLSEKGCVLGVVFSVQGYQEKE